AKRELIEHLEELAELADTAGATVVGELTQSLDRPNPATYLGKGKLDDLRAEAERNEATLIIFDDELSPAQARNVEEVIGVRVMDRAELILDIFATRAHTSEAKMQVELAQLQYMLPRLTRMWTHLEKFRGGIGMRGPGETQLETDRRLIAHRIRVLGERLSSVQKARTVQRQTRSGSFRAALVGYTNAGKSSILRALASADEVFVEDRLFATLDPLTRDVDLGDGQSVLVTDTVGFIRKLPHHLVASFRATLEEVGEADLLLHVIDLSHPGWQDRNEVVEHVLADLDVGEVPILHVFNKIDQVDHSELIALEERIQRTRPNSVFVSAVSADGLEPLRRALLVARRRLRPTTVLRLPLGDGKLLAELHRSGEVISQHSEGDDWIVTARLDEAMLGRMRNSHMIVAGDQALPESTGPSDG
ncbi:MAG TPA: GTPase HflX, partial [Gemmatimonadaceae bacterium]